MLIKCGERKEIECTLHSDVIILFYDFNINHASIKTGFYIPESSSTSKDEIKKKWANPNAQ